MLQPVVFSGFFFLRQVLQTSSEAALCVFLTCRLERVFADWGRAESGFGVQTLQRQQAFSLISRTCEMVCRAPARARHGSACFEY